MPISALLARIRRLIPRQNDAHYDEIVRNIGAGTLRPPPSPMTDRELSKAIAEFLKDAPSAENVSSLGRKLDPSSRVRDWRIPQALIGHRCAIWGNQYRACGILFR
jgi:hypothetical protein